ncbi:MAG: GGDEF domain-containing protein [Lachnospiraceae bacterium]|nr:GGDEF domain-containing protein [Lachnospiraceae bacterium]
MLERGLQYFKNWFHNDDNKKCYDTYREEIDQYNIRILNFFNALVLLLLVIVFFSGFFTRYVAPMQSVYIGTMAVTLLEITADKLVLFRAGRRTDAAVFLCMTKIYAFCILSGVNYSLNMPAVSFSVFMIVMPILFIVRSIKMNIFNLGAALTFCVCSYIAKEPSVALADIYNCIVFYLVASIISYWIVTLRIGFIRNEKLLTIQRDTDILTTLPNRRRFNIYARDAFEADKDRRISILMMDIDHFKAYNDSKGHIAGDYCLECIGKTLRKFGETNGIFFARYGGEEFVAIDRNRGSKELEAIAQGIVDAIYVLGLPHESSDFRRITISVGYASQSDINAEDYIQLLACADEALYQAKRQGRNKIAGYHREVSKTE